MITDIHPKVFDSEARGILSATSGFIREAGFTHSLTPARNCTFGCTYCYVPTLRIYAGLKREDWEHWGRHTTYKSNAAQLLARELKAHQRIYCSPLVDPYQPAEADRRMMPELLEALLRKPPKVFTIQTRGSLVLRDLDLLREVAKRTHLRVSFSVTTDDERIRRLYEPHCEPIAERLASIAKLRDADIEVYTTLAPLLPCNPERLAELAIQASGRTLIGDPLHVRATKLQGATTREAASRIAGVQEHLAWFDAAFQCDIVGRIGRVAARANLDFRTGPGGFATLAAD